MEITEAKYQEFLADQLKARTLETEVQKMKETAENTKVALKANREEIAALKVEKEKAETDFNSFKTEKEAELKKLEGFDDLKKNADNWQTHQAKLMEDRKKGIDEMKTKLGEEFMKSNEAFLDGLPEEKLEIYLKTNVDKLGTTPPVVTGAPAGGMGGAAGVAPAGAFTDAIAKGDFMGALSAIPAPSK